MMIYSTPHYLLPVIYLDEDEYRTWYNIEDDEGHNTYRSINEDIFKEVDEEYVNESIK